jgi:hypothetical protein
VNSFEGTSLYDLMETNEKITLSMVKEQLNHYKIRKVSDNECTYPLAWWKVHEPQFSYISFVVR